MSEEAVPKPTDHVVDMLYPRGIPFLTTHTFTLVVVTAIFLLAMLHAARRIATGPASMGNDRYITKGRFPQMIEAMSLYIRDQMLVPVLGVETTRKYLPYLLTLFFFILFVNVFGLVPFADLAHLVGVHEPLFGGTPTASITVTGALALIAFFVIQIHGLRDLGIKGYLQHLTGGLYPGPIAMAPIIAIVMIVEFAGLFIKPAALAIRLFANMVAGHTLMAVLLSFGAMVARSGGGVTGVVGISLISGVSAVMITFLEVFVAFLQAFIFMFLTAVFISLMSHHDEHGATDHGHEGHADDDGDAHPKPVPVHA
jgi:F-type H+-transporting ATPase subunit a